jgi:hypothetical protein
MSLEEIQSKMRERERPSRYVANRPSPQPLEKRPVLRLHLKLMCNCEYIVNYVRGSGSPPIKTYPCSLHGEQKLRACDA